MKKIIYIFSAIISLCFFNFISYAQVPDWLWAKSAGGSGYDAPNSIAIDASGNAYIAGGFSSSTINFGSTVLTNVNYTQCIVLKKVYTF